MTSGKSLNNTNINPQTEKKLRNKVIESAETYYKKKFQKQTFIPGKTLIPASSKVMDFEEMKYLIDASLDFWLTEGRFAKEFEQNFSKFLNVKFVSLTNSGSSANLLAFAALTSPILGDKAIKPGDEVITTASGFPTTINPIIQNGCIPVFVDINLETLNIDTAKIEQAISPKTKAIFLAHTLGNPFDLGTIMKIAKKYKLFVIEDSCDALGATYKNQKVGTIGDIGTYSFYPAHHMTMGEGGAVVTNNPILNKIIRSFRDWGRDCWCGTGHDDTCHKRFCWKFEGLPSGYDHKFVYSHLGYNLKLTDMQAAIGVAQLKKLPSFIKKRNFNYQKLYNGLTKYNEFLILPKPTPNSKPCWFGFPITVNEKSGITKNQIIDFLEDNKILTRLAAIGNITRQPYFKHIKYRISDDLKLSDYALENTFWIGIYPGITKEMIKHILNTFEKFFTKKTSIND